MNEHIHTTTAHPSHCEAHDRIFYRRTCGHGTGCRDCDLERAVAAARAALPSECHKRLEKAADLVRAGLVHVNGKFAVVYSQSEAGKVYRVNERCECPDARYQAPKVAGRPACKHQIAVWLKKKMHEKIEPQTLQTSEAHVRSQREATNEDKSTRRHGAVKPGTLNGKDYIAWCKRCQAETNFGFGLGCLDCLERYEQRKQRETALPAQSGYNERQLRHARETGTNPKLWK